MSPTISAFANSPDGGKGQARDMRVRWALEEVGQDYDVQLVSFAEMKEPAYRALQPFGQIPIYREDSLTLFESGAIVLHIAQHYQGLLPEDTNGRARALSWLFAALNTVEPPIVELEQAYFIEGDKPWYRERVIGMTERIRVRLAELSRHLGESEWLDGSFTVADLMMVMVLRRAEDTDTLEHYPNLLAYIARGEARPAYQRAYAAQYAVFVAASAKA